jgi:hypothetical protein
LEDLGLYTGIDAPGATPSNRKSPIRTGAYKDDTLINESIQSVTNFLVAVSRVIGNGFDEGVLTRARVLGDLL